MIHDILMADGHTDYYYYSNDNHELICNKQNNDVPVGKG